MRRLVVLYDGQCVFCVRCRQWLEAQRQLVPLELLAAGSLEARARFPGLQRAGTVEELVAVDDAGGVYRGSEAWIICLYALEEYREWSLRLARPALRPLARSAFEWPSHHRKGLSRRLGLAPEEEVVQTLAPMDPMGCDLPRKP